MSLMSAAIGWVVGSWSWRRAPVLYSLAKVTQPLRNRVASTWASTDMMVAKLSLSYRSSHQRVVSRSPNHMWAISCRMVLARSSRSASVTRERKIMYSWWATAALSSMAPALDPIAAALGVGDHYPVLRGKDGEVEGRLQVRLVEAGKNAVGVEGLELRVQVDPVVYRVLEARETDADVLVVAGAQDVELVGCFQVVQPDARAGASLAPHPSPVSAKAV